VAAGALVLSCTSGNEKASERTTLSRSVDPILSAPPWVAEGNQETAYLGLSVASAGDVNNDGFSDVIIGAPLYDNGQADEGRVFVHHGSATGLATTFAWSVEGNQAGARFGTSVASAGDVNGDGFGDVIIGAPNYDNGHTDEGRVYVHLGSATGLVTTAAWTAESNQVGALLGGSVAGAGDVNGDGFDDVILGAREYDNVETGEGRVFIHFGSMTGLALTPSWTGEIDQASAQFGFSVAGAGDVNGDMFDDVIIGAKVYANGETGEGAAFVYLGSMTGPALVADWTVESNRAGAGFGHAVASAGDVDNDGFSDVLVGAPAYNGGLAEEGRASLYLGSMTGLATTAEWNVESDQAAAELGFSVAGAGDVNADGFDDIVVGAQGLGDEAGGGVLVYLGSALPFAMTPDRTIEGSQARGGFGYAVASAGDVNDDGSFDVIVGAPLTDAGQLNEGRAFVFLGCVPTADTDGDSALDCADGCERDPEKTAPGVCGCGVADDDSDSDGTLDCNDECPDDAASTSDGCPGGGEGGAGGADDGGGAGDDTGGSAGSGGGATPGGSGGAAGSGGSAGNAGGGGANAGGGTGAQGGSAGRANGGTGTTEKPEPAGEDSSCGCRVPGSARRGLGISAPALLALALALGRRRARRRLKAC
jgi:hypothetical protein